MAEDPDRLNPASRTLDEATETLVRMLQSPSTREYPLFSGAERQGDEVIVNVQPVHLGGPITLRLKVVSATVIPHRPRAQRQP